MLEFIDQQSELHQLVHDILKEARQQGADQAEVSVSAEEGLGVSVRKGELENLEFNQDRGFGITLQFGQRRGTASTTDSSATAIKETVTAAKNIARFTEDDPYCGLADPQLMPEQPVDLDLHHPWALSPDAAQQLAMACEAAGLNVDSRIVNSDGAQISSQQGIRVYGNSHGFVGSYASTRHSLSCVLIAEDDKGMQRDYWYTVARNAAELEDANTVGVLAGERTVARLAPRKAPTGSFPILLAPQLAAGLIGHLLGAISGGAQYRKASFLLDSIGQQVLPEWLSLQESPLLPRSLGAAYFDGDGVATRNNCFVENGVLKSYVLSEYSARKLELETTANADGVHNLSLLGHAVAQAELLKEMGTGLFICELMGQGVNGVTGDYSRGAAGYWVENGEIAYPVDEFTIAGNLRDMLKNIVGMADDVDLRGNIRAPSLLLQPMTVAGE
ncbi:MAG: metalloprotease PmbA [Proteobacteria bacterium]|nr:metalloprotease PmbA [Pseudomonadota bacterium]